MQTILQNQLRGTATELGRFLNAQLPSIGGDSWWTSHVVNQLTYGQQGQIRTRGIECLEGLDIAALLRVFDRNWAELSHTARLPNEVRTHAKEVSDLRHSMAHHASGGTDIPITDGYRHLDTIERFLMAIGANKSAIDAARESKQAALIQMASGMAAPSPTQPEVVQEPAKKEEPVQVPGTEMIVVPQIIAPKTEVKVQTATRTKKGIAVASFQLIGPGESMATEIASFDGRAVAATAIPWTANGPDGHEFLIHVVLMDEDGEGEFGQVFCESRLNSPTVWDDIVRRLRVGIRRLSDGQLTMDLRIAVRENGERAAKRIVPLAEIDRLVGLDTSAVLCRLGANAVGSRAELTGETNRTRNWPSVTFATDDVVTPVAAFILTTLLSMMQD
ncbi:MAG: Swt1 family HEPN domain-containing protein [Verrucomicrobiota bacterium]